MALKKARAKGKNKSRMTPEFLGDLRAHGMLFSRKIGLHFLGGGVAHGSSVFKENGVLLSVFVWVAHGCLLFFADNRTPLFVRVCFHILKQTLGRFTQD